MDGNNLGKAAQAGRTNEDLLPFVIKESEITDLAVPNVWYAQKIHII